MSHNHFWVLLNIFTGSNDRKCVCNVNQAFNLNVDLECSPLTTNTLLPLSYKLKKKKKKKQLLLQLHLDSKDTSLVPNRSSIYALSIDTDGSHGSAQN